MVYRLRNRVSLEKIKWLHVITKNECKLNMYVRREMTHDFVLNIFWVGPPMVFINPSFEILKSQRLRVVGL